MFTRLDRKGQRRKGGLSYGESVFVVSFAPSAAALPLELPRCRTLRTAEPLNSPSPVSRFIPFVVDPSRCEFLCRSTSSTTHFVLRFSRPVHYILRCNHFIVAAAAAAACSSRGHGDHDGCNGCCSTSLVFVAASRI